MESVMAFNHLIPVILFFYCLNLSQHQGLSNESALCIRWAKYWSFSFNISPSNDYSGLISFRMDCLSKGWIVLAVQGTLKSLLQHHSSKASILWYSAFFLVQLSHPYMTTGKAIALTRWTFVARVMSLFFNTVSTLVIAFLQPLLLHQIFQSFKFSKALRFPNLKLYFHAIFKYKHEKVLIVFKIQWVSNSFMWM